MWKANQPLDLSKFQRALANAFVPLEVEVQQNRDFQGKLRGRASGSVHYTLVGGEKHTVLRTPAQIAKDDKLFYKLALQVSGSGSIVQGEKEGRMSPGSLTIYETGVPYTLDLEQDSETFVLLIPATMLDVPRETISELSTLDLHKEGTLGKIVTAHLQNLATDLNVVAGSSGHLITRGTLDLVLSLLTGLLAHDEAIWSPRQVLFQEVLEYLKPRLRDPSLTTTSVAKAHYISPRFLQDLFKENGTTFTAWMRERRLEACQTALKDPTKAHLSVGRVASEFSFQNPAHFSRIYKDKYGETPSETRQKALAFLVPKGTPNQNNPQKG